METLLNFDTKAEIFNFQKSPNTDAINNETLCIERKAHLFWEITAINAKVKELMSILSHSGKALSRLVMTGDSKDGKHFFATKKMEQEMGITQELGFVDSLFMMYQVRRKIVKVQAEMKAYNGVKQYTHSFGDFIFYKSMNFRSSYLEELAKERNEALNKEAKTKAAEYFLEVMILQYKTLLFSCEKKYMELVNFTLFKEFIGPLFEGKTFDQYLIILMV